MKRSAASRIPGGVLLLVLRGAAPDSRSNRTDDAARDRLREMRRALHGGAADRATVRRCEATGRCCAIELLARYRHFRTNNSTTPLDMEVLQ